MVPRDLTGSRFGKLVAQKRLDARRGGKLYWECACDCGGSTNVCTNALTSGRTRSCGCLWADGRRGHGGACVGGVSKMYRVWISMRARCERVTHPNYHHYGGRGVRVCSRWRSYAAFREDMGSAYAEGLSIDRIDNDGDYEPSNCRWATNHEQARNTRRNRHVLVGGVTMCVADAARATGICARTLRSRLASGIPADRAIDPAPISKTEAALYRSHAPAPLTGK